MQNSNTLPVAHSRARGNERLSQIIAFTPLRSKYSHHSHIACLVSSLYSVYLSMAGDDPGPFYCLLRGNKAGLYDARYIIHSTQCGSDL